MNRIGLFLFKRQRSLLGIGFVSPARFGRDDVPITSRLSVVPIAISTRTSGRRKDGRKKAGDILHSAAHPRYDIIGN